MAPDEEELLRSALARELPTYMLPQLFVALPQLPLGANGKVDRRKLSNISILRPLGPQVDPPICADDPIDRAVQNIWQDVLHLTEIPHISSGFFELGGDSIRALQCIARINRQYNLAIGVRTLYQHSQLSAFARAVTRLQQAQDLQKRTVGATSVETGLL